MVHQHRQAKKATIAKDVSPMRNMAINKYTLSSSPADAFGLGAMSLAVPKVTAGAVASNANQWKYNDMINNNRDQFNSLHFC